jgi:hypothetical protein
MQGRTRKHSPAETKRFHKTSRVTSQRHNDTKLKNLRFQIPSTAAHQCYLRAQMTDVEDEPKVYSPRLPSHSSPQSPWRYSRSAAKDDYAPRFSFLEWVRISITFRTADLCAIFFPVCLQLCVSKQIFDVKTCNISWLLR